MGNDTIQRIIRKPRSPRPSDALRHGAAMRGSLGEEEREKAWDQVRSRTDPIIKRRDAAAALPDARKLRDAAGRIADLAEQLAELQGRLGAFEGRIATKH